MDVMKFMKEKIDGLKAKIVRSGLRKVEIFLQRRNFKRVFFEKNELKTLNQDDLVGVGIRVVENNRQGFSFTNDPNEVFEVFDRAKELARLSEEDEYLDLPEPKECALVEGIYDDRFEEFDLERTLMLGKKMVEIPRRVDGRVSLDSAELTITVMENLVWNTLGLELSERKTTALFFLMGMAVEDNKVSSFDYVADASVESSDLDERIEKSARVFANRVISSLGAKSCPSYKGKVLLSPNAVGTILVQSLNFLVNSENVQEGRSPWAGKLNEKVASKVLTFLDSPRKPRKFTSVSFDREGVPTRDLVIIEDGVLKSYIYNTYRARRENKKSTGHASGGYQSTPSVSMNAPGLKGLLSLDEMLKMMDEGIFVRRYSGNVNPVNGIFSGTVKGGKYVKNGNYVYPLIGTMISGNIFELLNNITAISEETETTFFGELPYVLVDNVEVISS